MKIYRQNLRTKFANTLKRLTLQVDESTDITGKAQLLYFNRFIKDEKCVSEYLFCKDLQTTTKGEDIFNVENEKILFSNYNGKTVSVFAPMAVLPWRKVEMDLSLLCFKKIQMCLLFTA